MKRRMTDMAAVARILGAAALAGVFMTGTAFAQPVSIFGEPCPIPLAELIEETDSGEETAEETVEEAVTEAETEAAEETAGEAGEEAAAWIETETVLLTEFNYYGTVEDGGLVVIRFARQPEPEEETTEGEEAPEDAAEETAGEPAELTYEYGLVPAAKLQELLPQINVAALPDGTGLSDVVMGDDGDTVEAVQAMLGEAGIAGIAVDGAYGAGTQGAVRKFQQEYGLEETGDADVYTQLALMGVKAGLNSETQELCYPADMPLEERYPAVAGEAGIDLSPFTDFGWRLTYDRFERSGDMDLRLPVGSYSYEGADIDRISLQTALKVLLVYDAASDTVKAVPALTVDSEGAYRPFVQGAMFYDEEASCEISGGVSSGGVNGVTLYENGYVPLTQEILTFLSEHQDLQLRVLGKNQSYDMEFDASADKLEVFLEACISFFKD